MKELWEKAQKEGEESQFVNIADPDIKDPVIKDAWNTLGWRIKQEIAEAFGPNTFMVRRDMVDDAVGYRAASVTDFWTGTSRWSETSQKHIGRRCPGTGMAAPAHLACLTRA